MNQDSQTAVGRPSLLSPHGQRDAQRDRILSRLQSEPGRPDGGRRRGVKKVAWTLVALLAAGTAMAWLASGAGDGSPPAGPAVAPVAVAPAAAVGELALPAAEAAATISDERPVAAPAKPAEPIALPGKPNPPPQRAHLALGRHGPKDRAHATAARADPAPDSDVALLAALVAHEKGVHGAGESGVMEQLDACQRMGARDGKRCRQRMCASHASACAEAR
jgi:hypothetical protein